jgi:hypothetical protein
MNNLFSIEELYIIRQSLDIITILGKDAKNIATLQEKIENIIQELSITPETESASKTK